MCKSNKEIIIMKSKSLIRDNIALNAHPLGCKQNILNQIDEIKDLPEISKEPQNVLIIGGISGYGLSTRILLTYKANAYTYNVSFEREPRRRTSGSAGYYNNQYFNEIAKQDNYQSDDLNADAFSHQTKTDVINHFKSLNKKIDLVVYSVASGVRIDPDTNEKYISSLKPIKDDYTGLNVDIASETLNTQTLTKASQEEINNTVKVMGGEDYLLWANALTQANMLNKNAKFITYTYIGSELTYPIYKDGTIGYAKRDLEQANETINALLKPINGQAYISASKAVVTKASVFIPTMVLYVSALFKVMKEHNTHESTIQHKYRLFKDMVYGENPSVDSNNILRPDALELDPKVQSKVKHILDQVNETNFINLVDFNNFKKEFMALSGFDIDGVDYETKE